MDLWLKPNGYLSHQIDFKSHGYSNLWNGHFLYSKLLWKLITGKRHYRLNRMPFSYHMNILEKYGFKVIFKKTVKTKSEIKNKHLPTYYKKIVGDEDLITSGVFFQATKIVSLK